MANKMKHRRSSLLTGHLERISSEAFDLYRKEITTLVAHQHGVYALYKGDRLYYVGLATNLRQRVNHHLKDRHKKKWDRFSLYLVRKVNHLKELESLILHIAEPSGNRSAGRLGHSPNLVKELKHSMEMRDRRQREMILYGNADSSRKPSLRSKENKDGNSVVSLRDLLRNNQRLKASYQGKVYTAIVRSSGKIRHSGKLFDSPSAAAHNITKGPINGWWFWKAQDNNGNWVRLTKLRK